MRNANKYTVAMITIWVITMFPSMYYAYMQIQENKIVDYYLLSNNLYGLPINKETAVRVSDQVRKDFNTNESSFIALKPERRPFLREDMDFLLTYKEGFCGEGTRVIVNLLNRLGFDATRITLYDKKLEASHTLVSVVNEGKEFFVDSINSSEDVNRLLIKYNISSKYFDLIHYSDNFIKRREFIKMDRHENKLEFHKFFFDNYWLYSYTATPYTKILTKIGFDVRVFNFKRPNILVSVLAEKPNMIMSFVMLIASICIMYILYKFRIISNVFQKKLDS